jgi:RHS repeat-associated protein
MTHDADGNRLSVTAPDPSATTGTSTATTTTRSAYDAAGRLCRVLENASVDLDGTDRCTRVITGTATTNVSTRYTYDTAGNLATMIDGNGHATAYGYDVQGRLTTLTDATAGVLAWAYDDAARTRTQTNRTDPTPLTPTITWTSDAAGRVTSRAYLDEVGASRTTTYVYDLTGALATATDGTSTITNTPDRLGRPVTVTVTGDTAATTTYGYSFTAPTRIDASGATTMAVDPFGRITSLTDPVHASPFTWAYGAQGAVATAAAPNANSTAFTYDPLGRLLTKVTGTRAAYTQTFNRAGNRLSEASAITGDPGNGTATTGYDPLDRLTSYALPGIRTIADTWGAVPSRDTLTTDGVPSAQTYSDANRPTGAYTYDADGRMTARPGSSGGALEWDSLGRLARVRLTPGGTIVAAYTYDALDRLLTVDRSGTRIRFRYAGTTTAAAQVIDDATLTVIRNVAVGPEGTVLLDWLGADRRLYGTNGHHDTTWTADDTGAVTATLRYDPWGNVLRSTGSLPDWRFQGSWADTSTNLAWSVARWYDPVQGTFISEDSLLGEPANPASRHLYAYGAGEPVGSWDPGGRWPYTLNPYEQRLCDLHPGQCVAWGEASFWAGKLASFYWKDPIRNTMRHCMWSCLMSYSMGKVNAYVWARAHEYGSQEGPPYTDMRVDLHNNYVGRLLGAHLSEVWYVPVWKTARELCVGAWNKGWLWFNRGDKIYWSNGQYIKNAPFKWYP